MSAGQLRFRVDIQSPSTTVDELGQPTDAWTTTSMVWADIRYMTGLSAIKSDADVSVSRVSIRLRHGPYNAGQRVVYGTKVFNVLAVQPDTRKQYVDLVAEAINVQTV